MTRKPTSDFENAEYCFDHRHEWTGPLGREIARAMQNPKDKLLRRDKRDWRVFAGLVVDFMLDVANGAWLWRGYEAWNQRYFGVALPITEGELGTGLTRARLTHFVWKMLAVLDERVTLLQDNPDLLKLVEAITEFWDKRQSQLPKELGAGPFVAGPNREGYLVKRKLRILAETSYLFRTSCHQYVAEYAGTESEIDAIDSFLCQACTPWSGMGPIDLLAEVLDIPDARREDIRSWSERHLAPYRVDLVKPDQLRVVNLITNTRYETEFDNAPETFHTGMVLFGALVPWDGHWRWSSAQRYLGDANTMKVTIEQYRENMKRTMSHVLCRYWQEYREQVIKQATELHAARLAAQNGNDLVYFKDAKALIEDTDAFFLKRRDNLMREHGKSEAFIKDAPPPASMTLPEHLRDSANGVGEFLNPDEGVELMFGFDFLLSAFDKRGVGLTRDEQSVLRDFIQADSISPAFVKRVLRDHSPQAIMTEFGLPADTPDYWLEWLLCCWKGEYYRIRYPEVSVL